MPNFLNKLGAGCHAAFFYRSRQEQFSVVMPFIKEGLARGERCLYVVDDNSVAIVIKGLKEVGINVEKEQSRDALKIATKYETFVRNGVFEPQQMIDDLKAEVQLSIAQGFTGFRGAGEMTWAVNTSPACALLHEYEASLDLQFPVQFAGLCQYNENCFSPELISGLIRTHPIIVARGQVLKNSFYMQDGLALDHSTLPQVDVNQVLLKACA